MYAAITERIRVEAHHAAHTVDTHLLPGMGVAVMIGRVAHAAL